MFKLTVGTYTIFMAQPFEAILKIYKGYFKILKNLLHFLMPKKTILGHRDFKFKNVLIQMLNYKIVISNRILLEMSTDEVRK